MKFGVHTSISDGFDQAAQRAADLECATLQIFSSNPRGWKAREIEATEVEQLQDNLAKYKLQPLVIHTPYLLNLASPKEDLYAKSQQALKQEVRRADRLGADYLVLHPGSHTGSGIEAGIARVGQALDNVLAAVDPEVMVLLENVAGRGTAVGASREELARIFTYVDDVDQLGICFDTCHGFAAGYDLRDKEVVDQLVTNLDSTFGLEKLGVIHVNDSQGEVGSNKDRHQHIGQGEIGLVGFKNLICHPLLQDKPFILETPVDEAGDDQQNLATLRSLKE
ncbi:deoxyribonuclease IV [Halanaerobaculum tunisiense]